LTQPHWVYGQCAQVLWGVNDEAVLVLVSKLSGGADDVIDQRSELHGLWVELELSGLDLWQVEPSAIHWLSPLSNWAAFCLAVNERTSWR
jgi:hypothetical protein